jgi:hypothetical protein
MNQTGQAFHGEALRRMHAYGGRSSVLEGLSWKFGFEDVVSSGPNAFTPSGERTPCELLGAELVYVF